MTCLVPVFYNTKSINSIPNVRLRCILNIKNILINLPSVYNSIIYLYYVAVVKYKFTWCIKIFYSTGL